MTLGLPTGLWFIVLFVVVAGILSLFQLFRSGMRLGEIFDAGQRGKAVPGIHVAKHAVGACFMAVFLLIAFVLSRSAGCIIGRTPEGNAIFDLTREGCSEQIYGAYVVLSDWQEGIGAALGLLGVGYAALLAAIMAEDILTRPKKPAAKES